MSLSIGELVGYVSLDTAEVGTGVTGVNKLLGGISWAKMGAAGVAAAGAVGAALYGVGSVFDDVGDTIRTQTGATGKELDGLTKSAEKIGKTIPDSFGTIAPVLAQVHDRLDITGKPLEKLTKQFVEAGRITGQAIDVQAVTGMFNAFDLGPKQASKALDTLFSTSQSTGVGMSQLAADVSANAPILKTFGFTAESSAALVGNLDKAGLNASATVGTMRRALVAFAKDGKDPQKALKGTVDRISELIAKGDEAGATNLAGKVFGTRGASQFVAAVKSGKLNLDQLMGAQKKGGDTILKAAKDTNDFSESWQMFKNKALLQIKPLGEKVFTALSHGMDSLNKGGIPAIRSFVKSVAAGEGPVGHLATALEMVAKAGVSVGSFFMQHRTTALALVAAMAALVTVTQAHAAVMAVEAAGGILKYLASTKLVTAATKAWAAVQWLMNAALTANPIGLIVVGIAALVGVIVLIATKTDWFQKLWASVWGKIGGPVTAAVDFIKSHWKLLVAIITGPLGIVVYLVVKHWAKIKAATSAAWDGIKGALSAAWGAIKGVVSKGVGFVRDEITGIKVVASIVKAAFESARKAVGDKIAAVKSLVTGIPGKITGALGDLHGLLLGAGKAIVQGLIDGIQAMVKPLTDKLHSITKLIPHHKGPESKDKKLLVHNGKLIMQGLLDGLDAGTANLKKLLHKITDKLPKGMESAVLKAVKQEYALGLKIAASRKDVAAKLDVAKQTLLDAIAVHDDMAASVKSAAIDFASLASVDTGSTPLTADAVVKQMQTRLTAIETFRQHLATLVGEGLDDDSYKALVDKGVQAGDAIATALLKDPASVTAVASLSGQIKAAADRLGTDTSGHMYQAGIDAAQAVVDGLQVDKDKLQNRAQQIASQIAKAIKDALKLNLSTADLLATNPGGGAAFTPAGGGGRHHDKDHDSHSQTRGREAPLIGQVIQQPGESSAVLSERLWYLTKTRG